MSDDEAKKRAKRLLFNPKLRNKFECSRTRKINNFFQIMKYAYLQIAEFFARIYRLTIISREKQKQTFFARNMSDILAQVVTNLCCFCLKIQNYLYVFCFE